MGNNLTAIIFLVIFFGVLAPAALFFILFGIKKDRESRNNVENIDSYRNQYFLVPCGKSKAIEILSTRNAKDAIKYDFDPLTLKIRFEEYHSVLSVEYPLSFYEVEEQTFLKVGDLHHLTQTGVSKHKINLLFVEKTGAVPIDYRRFDAVVGSDPN